MKPLAGTLEPLAKAKSVQVVTPWYLAGRVTSGQCVAAYQPKGAASLAESYINLNQPGTYDLKLGVAPSFDPGVGWTGTGTQYLKTGIIPSATWSALVRFSGTTSGNSTFFGAYTSNIYFVIEFAPTYIGYGNGGFLTKDPTMTSGVVGFAGQTSYRNGNADGAIPPEVGTHTNQIYVMAFNVAGSLVRPLVGSVQAIAFYNIVLSAPQVLAITTAMQAL